MAVELVLLAHAAATVGHILFVIRIYESDHFGADIADFECHEALENDAYRAEDCSVLVLLPLLVRM